jgi:GTP-binding protein
VDDKKNIFGTAGDKAAPSKKSASKNHGLRLVDLPGYGFAYANDEAYERYSSLMVKYILNRGRSLKRVLLLIDSRHGMKISDFDFLMKLDKGCPRGKDLPPIQIVLTKCDMVTQQDLARRVVRTREELMEALSREPGKLPTMLVSAKGDKRGIIDLQKAIAGLAGATKGKK